MHVSISVSRTLILTVFMQIKEEEHPRSRGKKDLRALPSDPSSNDSLPNMQCAAYNETDENKAASANTEESTAPGPTTRRAWQDFCKSGNTSQLESQSDEEEGNTTRKFNKEKIYNVEI